MCTNICSTHLTYSSMFENCFICIIIHIYIFLQVWYTHSKNINQKTYRIFKICCHNLRKKRVWPFLITSYPMILTSTWLGGPGDTACVAELVPSGYEIAHVSRQGLQHHCKPFFSTISCGIYAASKQTKWL
jgi:hypothetical protein